MRITKAQLLAQAEEKDAEIQRLREKLLTQGEEKKPEQENPFGEEDGGKSQHPCQAVQDILTSWDPDPNIEIRNLDAAFIRWAKSWMANPEEALQIEKCRFGKRAGTLLAKVRLRDIWPGYPGFGTLYDTEHGESVFLNIQGAHSYQIYWDGRIVVRFRKTKQ